MYIYNIYILHIHICVQRGEMQQAVLQKRVCFPYAHSVDDPALKVAFHGEVVSHNMNPAQHSGETQV